MGDVVVRKKLTLRSRAQLSSLGAGIQVTCSYP